MRNPLDCAKLYTNTLATPYLFKSVQIPLVLNSLGQAYISIKCMCSYMYIRKCTYVLLAYGLNFEKKYILEKLFLYNLIQFMLLQCPALPNVLNEK